MTRTQRGLTIHGVLLAAAAVTAFRTWTYDESKAPKHGETDLWSGTPEQVQEVRFEAKAGTLSLEPRQDSFGKYYIGHVKKAPQPPEPKKDGDQSQAEPPPSNEPKLAHFIATKEGEQLIDSVAPLRALRVLGKITGPQKVDFGLDKEEGKLYVRVGGKEHRLVFGGTTPGGSDYYVTDPATGDAYVVAGSIFRDLTSADQRLLERNLHGFEDSAVKRVKITVGNASRELVRSTDNKEFWSKPDSPKQKDETATNWMTKVSRVHVVSYEGEKIQPAPAPADMVVRIDYFDERKQIGYLELVRRAGEKPDKPEYVARSEHTRWYASVIRSSAEQVDQDTKSVIAP
jgi:hypothetical protein